MLKFLLATLLATPLNAAAQVEQTTYETPTMGWSSWNTFGYLISEDIIKKQADAMIATGLNEAGYRYINTDDGFFGGRDENGKLRINAERFPNGLKPVVDHIHSLGLKAGIYSDAGKNTCASFWGKPQDLAGKGSGLYLHDQEDIDFYFKDMNFDFIKVDFCGGEKGNNDENLELDKRERYTAIWNAILRTGRKDVRMNVCCWRFPGTWVHDVATSWRTTYDIALGWQYVRDIIKENLYLSAYATEGKFNDMDMLEVGRGMTKEEDRTHFGMWCIMSSPLLIGCDMTKISDETLSLLKNKELIALNQDPLALQAYVVKQAGGAYVLIKDIEKANDRTRAVAFYNPTDVTRKVTLDFSEVDLGGEVAMRDLFEGKDLPNATSSYSITLPPHATRIYKLTGETRLERTVYEAETAWLSDYQELENNQTAQTAVYTENVNRSGGAIVGWLGNRETNDLQWRNVYSFKGGDYTMKLTFESAETRNVTVSVNGEEVKTLSLKSEGWNKTASIDIPVKLNAGYNVVRLSNANGFMPDIDCMTLYYNGNIEAIRESLTQKTDNLVNVYHIDGRLLKQNQKTDEAVKGLDKGLYIIGGKVTRKI